MKVAALFLSVVMATSMAFGGNDQENKKEVSVDTSKNPITGTRTVTKTTVAKSKMGKNESETETTEKTKYKKDGTVEKSVETDASSSSSANKKH